MSTNGEMQLILGTTPESNWQGISEFFELAGWAVSHNKTKACYEKFNSKASASQRFILLHSHPVEAIAHAIDIGTPPEQAKESWLTAAREMVDFYTNHRKQAVMVYIPNLLSEPKAQLTTVATHLELKEQPQSTISVQTVHAPVLERILANQLLQQDPGITTLLARIEACTIPQEGLSYSASTLDINAANRELVTLKANLKKNEQLSEIVLQSRQYQEENDILLDQLHLVQERLEAKYLSHDQLNEELLQSRESETDIAKIRDQNLYALAVANHHIQRLQTELSGFKTSTIFKVKSLLGSLKAMVLGSASTRALEKQAKLIDQSGIFNEGWYLTTYPDVAKKSVDPIVHYLKYGAAELRNPSPEFDTQWYLSSHPDVAKENMNPALHYSMFGQNEGRLTSPHEHQSHTLAKAA